MKPITYITLLLVFIYSCTNQQGNQASFESMETEIASVTPSSEFQKLCENLPKVQLPFSVYCEECCTHPELSDAQTEINKYLPEGSSFVGIIDQSEEYISILTTYPADWIIPAVIVLNPEGKLVDEEVFLGGYCGSDYGYVGKQYFFINDKRQLLEIDTAYQVTHDEETFKIVDTTSTEIQNKKFSVDKDGIHSES